GDVVEPGAAVLLRQVRTEEPERADARGQLDRKRAGAKMVAHHWKKLFGDELSRGFAHEFLLRVEQLVEGVIVGAVEGGVVHALNRDQVNQGIKGSSEKAARSHPSPVTRFTWFTRFTSPDVLRQRMP